MLSLALKNGIIVILIIIVLHMILRKQLRLTDSFTQEESHLAAAAAPINPSLPLHQQLPPPPPPPPLTLTTGEGTPPPPGLGDKDEDELLKYIKSIQDAPPLALPSVVGSSTTTSASFLNQDDVQGIDNFDSYDSYEKVN